MFHLLLLFMSTFLVSKNCQINKWINNNQERTSERTWSPRSTGERVLLVLNIFSRAGEGRSFCVKEIKKKTSSQTVKGRRYKTKISSSSIWQMIFFLLFFGSFQLVFFSTFGALDKDLVRRRPFRSTGLKRMRDNNRNNIFKLLQKQQPAPLF